ncbi:hypothetical protein M404DRAFT_895011 [Pisolithus tinctorius Marx 270]|uniref:Extracellular membrane protein CFEM domain-containing protein n=1 Tax=Pisolithus tinctorius Marx 270 TaxID=870435 RepID=A0A0C3NQ71_PISTI|nr:hypothetical protein M404DRAFT_895011 [Pisolithus tinctorius Marx 270]
MRVVSLVITAFVAVSGAQNIGPGPYSADAIQVLYGASVVSQCTTTCSALANNTSPSGCQASLCCESNFIQTYRDCIECIMGALPPPPTTSQDHTNHTSYAVASHTGSQLSPTQAPATGTAVVAVPPASSVISPISPFSGSHTSTTSVGATPSSTNSAVRTTVGQAYSSIAWHIHPPLAPAGCLPDIITLFLSVVSLPFAVPWVIVVSLTFTCYLIDNHTHSMLSPVYLVV